MCTVSSTTRKWVSIKTARRRLRESRTTVNYPSAWRRRRVMWRQTTRRRNTSSNWGNKASRFRRVEKSINSKFSGIRLNWVRLWATAMASRPVQRHKSAENISFVRINSIKGGFCSVQTWLFGNQHTPEHLQDWRNWDRPQHTLRLELYFVTPRSGRSWLDL